MYRFRFYKSIVKQRRRIIELVALCGLFSFSSCEDSLSVDNEMSIIMEESITDYVSNEPSLSMFKEVLTKSKISELGSQTLSDILDGKGQFNVFAPSNEALKIYLNKRYNSTEWSIDTMSQDIANDIVLNSIIDCGTAEALLTSDFPEGSITQPTLSDRHIMVSFDSVNTNELILNGKSKITTADVQLCNGVLNIIDVVLSPYTGALPSLIAKAGNLHIFSYILEQTGWADSMLAYRDEEYELYTDEEKKNDKYFFYTTPPHRYYGYMAFTETDEVFLRDWDIPEPIFEGGKLINAIEIRIAIEKKCKEAYPKADCYADWTSQKNPVNQFVSYHLVPFKEPYNLLVRHGDELGYNTDFPDVLTMDLWTYFHTMGKPNRLFKITHTIDNVFHINRMSYHNNAFDGDMKETAVVDPGITISATNGNFENDALNGYYFPIDKVMVYTDFTRDAVLNERIRYNMAQYFDEMMSNDLRTGIIKSPHYYIPHHPYFYCKHLMNFTDTDYRTPINAGSSGWTGIESDQFAFSNLFDVTFQLMPVPFAGTWEVRYAVSNIAARGLGQGYFGTNPDNLVAVGLPFDFRIVGSDPRIGSITDNLYGYDSVFCQENDRQMRNHMHMKSGRTYCSNQFGVAHTLEQSLRNRASSLRLIVYRGYMEPDKTYYFRFKTLLTKPDAYLFGDCFELVPSTVWDNPQRQEDVW